MEGTVISHQYDEWSPKVRMEIGSDATAPAFVEAVIGVMKCATYADESIYRAMRDAADEYFGGVEEAKLPKEPDVVEYEKGWYGGSITLKDAIDALQDPGVLDCTAAGFKKGMEANASNIYTDNGKG